MAITLVLSSLVHSSLKVHFSYRLKFLVVYYHLRNSSFYHHSLPGSRFTRSYSTRPSQRSKYTGGVVRRMRRCVVIRRLSRKCVQKKKTLAAMPKGLRAWIYAFKKITISGALEFASCPSIRFLQCAGWKSLYVTLTSQVTSQYQRTSDHAGLV